MNSGVTSLTAVMAKTDLGGEAYAAKYGENEYVDLVSAYSLYVGIASVVMALVGFGKLAQNVPGAVKTGFKQGEHMLTVLEAYSCHVSSQKYIRSYMYEQKSGVVN